MPAIMTTKPEGHGSGMYRLGDHDPNINSEQVALAPTTVPLPDGTVLAIPTTGANSGKYVPIVPGGADGTGTFAGILFGAKPISTTDQRVVVDVRGPMHINPRMLNYITAPTDPQRIVIETAMKAAGIQPRR